MTSKVARGPAHQQGVLWRRVQRSGGTVRACSHCAPTWTITLASFLSSPTGTVGLPVARSSCLQKQVGNGGLSTTDRKFGVFVCTWPCLLRAVFDASRCQGIGSAWATSARAFNLQSGCAWPGNQPNSIVMFVLLDSDRWTQRHVQAACDSSV